MIELRADYTAIPTPIAPRLFVLSSLLLAGTLVSSGGEIRQQEFCKKA